MKKPATNWGVYLRACFMAALAWTGTSASTQTVPLTIDWSHKHLVVTNAATLQERIAASEDPRAITNWIRRSQASSQFPGLSRRASGRRPAMQRDWSVSLGAGRVAPGMSPAKYGFAVGNAASCASDYVVYGLDVAGTPNTAGGQANLVGLRNLYSGGVAGNQGSCGAVTVSNESRTLNAVTITTATTHSFKVGMQVVVLGLTDASANGTWTVTTVPSGTQFTYTTTGLTGSGSSVVGTASYAAASVFFAYNITTSVGGRVLTSPSISLDGKKMAFVESTATSSIFHVVTLDNCLFSGLGCTTNGTAVTSAAVPGSGNSAAMVSISYSSSSNTLSSPWIDYNGDAAYIGDDSGKLYRVTGVFLGTPTLDASFGGTGSVTVNSGAKLTGPVLAQGWLTVGDSTGKLWGIKSSSPFTIVGPVTVGGGVSGLTTYGVVDPPVVDASTSGVLSIFATSGQNATSGSFALVQATLTTATPALTLVANAAMGQGAGTSLINGHAPTFDNNYYNGTINGTQGFIYGCGMQAASTHAKLYRFGFTAGSPPTMSTTANGTVVISNASVECSPLTEFANPNITVTDLLFMGDTSGEVQSFNITGNMPTGPAAGPVTESGGTSGIIVDNTQLTTNQGSSIYFTTLSNASGNCGAGNYCAIKLTQATLQ